ncbi:bacteriophage holin [Parasphingorhabdus pacifica]
MPYVSSLVLLGIGLLLLVLLLIKTLRTLNLFRTVQKRAVVDFNDRSGMLKARMAGIRVAVDEWRR